MKAGFAAIVAAAGLVASPVVAADRGASLSVAKNVRAAAPSAKGDKLAGDGGRFLIGAGVVAAIVAGIFIAAHEIGSDDPDSN